MTHVLVTGANGYIGAAVAAALRQRGHTVYGLVRKEADREKLIAQEIIPVVGEISDLKSVEATLEKVSIVVDNVMNYADNPPLESNRKLLAKVAELSRKAPQKKRYIYTSGCLVYGDYGAQVVDESMPLKSKVPRVTFEQEILKKPDVEITVVRPSWVYGGVGNSYIADWYGGNDKGEVVVKGNPNKFVPWIHIHDLAQAYVLVAEAGSGLVAGEIFDVADPSRVTAEQAKVAFARAAGVKGPVVHVPADPDPFSQYCEASILISSNKLRKRLGWAPTRQSVLDDQDLYYKAAVASGVVKRK